MRVYRLFILLVELSFILLFSYTAMDKLINIQAFDRALSAQIFPVLIYKILKWVIPLSEMLVAGILLTGVIRNNGWERRGLQLATGLMTAFTVYIVLILLNVFYKVPCGCAGLFITMDWTDHLIFNLVFIAAGIAALMMLKKLNNKVSRSN